MAITTPDTDHFLRWVMRKRWPMLQAWQHTYLFSRRAMRRLLSDAGFVDILIGPAGKCLSIDYLFGQIRNDVPTYFKIYRLFSRVIPNALLRKPMFLNISEMAVTARKPVAK